MSSRNGTLKRQRLRTGEESAAEPSPSPASVKKRRLNDTSHSSPAASKPSNLIADAWNGVRNLGRRLASGHTSLPAKDKSPDFEVPDSDEERKAKSNSPSLKKATTAPKPSMPSSMEKRSNIYDVPDSDEELGLPEATQSKKQQVEQPDTRSVKSGRRRGRPPASSVGSGKKTATRPKRLLEREVQDEPSQTETPTKRGPGRPRKNPPATKDVGELFPPEALLNPSLISSKLVPRKKRDGSVSTKQQATPKPRSILTPDKRDSDRRRKTVAFDKSKDEEPAEVFFEDIQVKMSSSRRAIKPSRKQAEILADQRAVVHAARRTKRNAIEQPEQAEEDEEEQDEVDTTTSMDVDGEDSQEERAVDDVDMEEEEERLPEEDDEVCAICGNPDSRASNQILFCDSCDMAVHQKCYGVLFIPKGDWFCRKCAPPEPALTQESAEDPGVPSQVALHDQKPDIPNFATHLQTMQRVLLDRCTGRRRIKLRGQDDAYEKTAQLVEQTIMAGEGNSMLIIGARGSGKTTLVESILHDMSKSHEREFHVVRLNGFIHMDDKLAVKEIWQQLGKELEEEEQQMGKANSYADTMAYLLSLLSHPSEYAEGQEGVTSQSVIFVIDEFDLFATHGRQTLLYNLLDYAQARKAPIAVLGLTTRIDVVESLEKRVKSRFSHRYVYLGLPKSVPAFWDICKHGVTIDEEDLDAEGIDRSLEGHAQFWEWWNKRIEGLYKSQGFRDHLEFHFHSTKSVPAFLTTCVLPISTLSPESLALRIPSEAFSLEPPDSKLHVLGSLSDLDLAMLICAARLDIIAHTDVVNFAMAYDEYTSQMGKLRVQSAASGMLAAGGQARVWGRGVAAIAWERLVDLGLLLPAGVGARGGAGQAGAEGKMWKVDVVLEEIPGAAELNSVLAKWCKEI